MAKRNQKYHSSDGWAAASTCKMPGLRVTEEFLESVNFLLYKIKEKIIFSSQAKVRYKQTNKTNELYFMPITVHRKTWSSNMDDNTKVE